MDLLGRLGRAALNSPLLDTATTVLGQRLAQATDNSSVQEIVGRSNVDDLFDFEPCYRAGDHVARYPVFLRAGPLILHGPITTSIASMGKSFNIILHQPNSPRMFSLFRTDSKEEAQRVFETLKEGIRGLAEIEPEIFDKAMLDKMCRKLRSPEAHGWTAMHLSAAFGFIRPMREQRILKDLNHQCTDLRTPLHVAICSSSTATIWELLSLGAQVDLKDRKENSVLHCAAEQDPAILAIILEKRPKGINELNLDGLTPLHIACKANRPENVKALLDAGADVGVDSEAEGYPIHAAVRASSVPSIEKLMEKDPAQADLRDTTTGGTPLHYANEAESIETLLAHGSDPNVVNFELQAPLHTMVRRGCLKSVIGLLSHSANPDIRDGEGETPLMLACRLCSKSIIQTLIVFGADINLVNNQRESPRHLLAASQRSGVEEVLFFLTQVGAKRCPPELGRCTKGCSDPTFDGIPPENYNHPERVNLLNDALAAATLQKVVEGGQAKKDESEIGGRLLCLDGGGIRGLVLTQILLFIEQVCGVHTIDLFDWIAGTSTGGILALGLATGKSVAEIQGLYMRLKDKVFVGERPYSSLAMDEFLKREFGAERRMSSIRRPRVMITTALVERTPVALHFFRNYLSPSALLGEREPYASDPDEELVWECAKRTGAAPSFFRLEGKFIDGGLIANNPTLDALTELVHFKAALGAIGDTRAKKFTLPSVVVSLGTGIQPSQGCNATSLDIAWPSGFLDAVTKVPRIATLINLLVDQATQAEGQVVERARAWCSSSGIPYHRFSPAMSTTIELDESGDETLVNLMWETRAYMFAHLAEIEELKLKLFNN